MRLMAQAGQYGREIQSLMNPILQILCGFVDTRAMQNR
jgi:hypothetical protein